jgi:hypothetical protein
MEVQITYRGLDPSEALGELIHKEAEKLGKFFDRIVACRVLVEREQHDPRSRVRIDLTVPGGELTIDTAKSSGTSIPDPALAVRDGFRRARRRIHDFVRRKMGPHVRASVR